MVHASPPQTRAKGELRCWVEQNSVAPIVGVEIDATFVGEKVKNMHRDRRARFAAQNGHTGGATGTFAELTGKNDEIPF
jgi:hypothetical protein